MLGGVVWTCPPWSCTISDFHQNNFLFISSGKKVPNGHLWSLTPFLMPHNNTGPIWVSFLYIAWTMKPQLRRATSKGKRARQTPLAIQSLGSLLRLSRPPPPPCHFTTSLHLSSSEPLTLLCASDDILMAAQWPIWNKLVDLSPFLRGKVPKSKKPSSQSAPWWLCQQTSQGTILSTPLLHIFLLFIFLCSTGYSDFACAKVQMEWGIRV